MLHMKPHGSGRVKAPAYWVVRRSPHKGAGTHEPHRARPKHPVGTHGAEDAPDAVDHGGERAEQSASVPLCDERVDTVLLRDVIPGEAKWLETRPLSAANAAEETAADASNGYPLHMARATLGVQVGTGEDVQLVGVGHGAEPPIKFTGAACVNVAAVDPDGLTAFEAASIIATERGDRRGNPSQRPATLSLYGAHAWLARAEAETATQRH